ncbi:MAG: DNA translocase FtsK [Clostridia bacterium]
MIEKFWNFIRNENNNDLLVETIKENKEVLLEQKNAEIKEKKESNNQNEIPEIETEKIEYNLPPIELLDTKIDSNRVESKKILVESAQKLQRTLYSFGVKAKVKNISIGPTITTYEIRLDEGISVNKVKKIKDDLALNLETKIIDIKIIPEKQLVGIETERRDKELVEFGEIIRTKEFENSISKLTIGLGKNIYGKYKIIDIEKTSHMLVSGTTGSGKSMFLHVLINSILYKAKPNEVKFLMIDTKVVELSLYNKIPHLLVPVITNKRNALGGLAWLCQEMQNRYVILANKRVRNIEEYNKKQNKQEKLPNIILIIDEYADLIEMDKKEIEEYIYILTQKARAVGIYIIIVTERPSINIINGTIKANIPTRVAFKVSSQIDSKVILDVIGAEKLLGNGDMIFKEVGVCEPKRYQCAFISNNELEKVTNYIKEEKNK